MKCICNLMKPPHSGKKLLTGEPGQMKNFQTQNAPFISRVQDLPEIKNSMLGDLLTGDHKAQLQYKKLVKAGGGDILEDFINRLAATSLAGTDEQPDGS